MRTEPIYWKDKLTLDFLRTTYLTQVHIDNRTGLAILWIAPTRLFEAWDLPGFIPKIKYAIPGNMEAELGACELFRIAIDFKLPYGECAFEWLPR